MRYSDLIKDQVLDLVTILDAEGIHTISLDVLIAELQKAGHDTDSSTLISLLDQLAIVDNVKDGVVYFHGGENDGSNEEPDPEQQDNKIDKMARKQVKKELDK